MTFDARAHDGRRRRTRRHRHSALLLGGVLACVLTVSTAAGRAAVESPPAAAQPNPATDVALDLRAVESKAQEIYRRAMPAVVSVSGGSGVVVSADGYVLTVAHVGVRSGRRVTITFPDGTAVRGRTLGNDRGEVDAGLIKIDGDGPFPFVPMGRSADLQRGTWCLAVGYPVRFERGKPPALRIGRVLQSQPHAIITDCTIMGGDSGGPLLDLEGNLIGISSRCDDRLTTNIHVAIDCYRANWERLVAGEDFASTPWSVAYLGVDRVEDSSEPRIGWIYDGSGAAQAGLQVGDLLLKFDGTTLSQYDQLPPLIERRRPGDEVEIEVRRGDDQLTLKAKLGAREDWVGRFQNWWRRDQQYRKNDARVRAACRAAMAVTTATLEVLADGQLVAWGTVVDPRGYVVTKASLLSGEISCRVAGGAAWPATLVRASLEHDLALLKVDAGTLTAVTWRTDPVVTGTLVAAVAPDGEAAAIGVVSAEPRAVPRSERYGHRRAWLGISLGEAEAGVAITEVFARTAASRAGLQVGDAIQSIDGQAMRSADEIVQTVGSRAPGDSISIVIERGDQQLTKKAVLGRPQREEDQWGGGRFSERREGFPQVLPHDTPITPEQCGGPLVDGDGRVVGINIARAVRVTSYALPADVVQQFVAQLE